jgi:hypothetical protein
MPCCACCAQHYMRTTSAINGQIVALGVDTYLSMLLRHNFVHTGARMGPMGQGQVAIFEFGDAERSTPFPARGVTSPCC